MSLTVFVVSVCSGNEAYDLATRLVHESGIKNYADAVEFFPDGIQDPYRAVDEVDALIWIYRSPASSGGTFLGMSDYNYLYADTVMQRAVRTGKPILYYHLPGTVSAPSPAVLRGVTRRAAIYTLSELEIKLKEDIRDLLANRIPFYNPNSPSIFLSYSHNDRHFARLLRNDLQLAGARVCIDEGEIQVGDSLIRKIQVAIEGTDYFGVILSPDSVSSRWVEIELDIAMNQEINGKKVKVLPLVYRKCELPSFLKGKMYADFSDDYNHALSQVLIRLGLSSSGIISA